MPEIVSFGRDCYVENLCKIIQKQADECLKDQDRFVVAVSGGSLVKYLCEGLPKISSDWSKWWIFFCDERIVPENSDDSISGMYKRLLLPKIPFVESQFVSIKYGVSTIEAAADYREKISNFFNDGMPIFDLLLMGMGPDGHTCSLFPNHPLLDEVSLTVAAIFDSPKPPPERITLTLPVINNAKTCLFAVTGEDKAQTLKDVIINKVDLPVSRVRPINGKVIWVADDSAASLLNL